MGQEIRRFTPEEYARASSIIQMATGAGSLPDAPTGTDIANSINRILTEQERLRADARIPLADVKLALAVHTSLTPPREDYEDPDRVLDWLKLQHTFATERPTEQMALIEPKTPLRDSLQHYVHLGLTAVGKVARELFPESNTTWNRTRRELAGIAAGATITVALAINPQIHNDALARTMDMIGQTKCEPLVTMLIESGANTNSTPKDELVKQCTSIYYNGRYQEELIPDGDRLIRWGYVLMMIAGAGTAAGSTISMSNRALNGARSLRRLEAAQ